MAAGSYLFFQQLLLQQLFHLPMSSLQNAVVPLPSLFSASLAQLPLQPLHSLSYLS